MIESRISRQLPAGAPPLRFTAADQQRAYDLYGANCGPGAIAGLCGTTPDKVALLLGEKLRKIGGTTEMMLRKALKDLGVHWREREPGQPRYGICRVQWDGPWIVDPDPFEKLRHSHWIGMACEEQGDPLVFDINAISVGGWLGLTEWNTHLRPWLLRHAEPLAGPRWWISETLEIPLPQPAIPILKDAS